MKFIKFLLMCMLMIVSTSVFSQSISIGIGGHWHGNHASIYYGHNNYRYYGRDGYRYYGYHEYVPRYYQYRSNIVISVPVVIRNYDPYAGFIRVPIYCTNKYDEQYFCGYEWVRE